MIIKRKLFAKKKYYLSWSYRRPNIEDPGYEYYRENVFDKFNIKTEDDLENLDLQYSGNPHTYKHYQRWINENNKNIHIKPTSLFSYT